MWTIAGVGIAARHALVRVAAGRIRIENPAGGTPVNSHPITGRVEADCAVSVQVGELTLMVELKDQDPAQAASIAQSPGPGGAGFYELEATVMTPRTAWQPAGVRACLFWARSIGAGKAAWNASLGGARLLYREEP